MNLARQIAPTLRIVGALIGQHLRGAIERDPAHGIGIGVLLRTAAPFPDPRIGLGPDILQTAGQIADQSRIVTADAMLAGEVERIDDLAENIELQLAAGAVAEPYRPCVAETGEPIGLPLHGMATAVDAVERLDRDRFARQRAPQPFDPLSCFVVMPGAQEREQREGRISQPAKAIIPVPYPARAFRQGSGGGGDDAAGLVAHQPLEDDQRTPDQIIGIPRIIRFCGPIRPLSLGFIEDGLWINRVRRSGIAGKPAERETHAFALPDLELARQGAIVMGDGAIGA